MPKLKKSVAQSTRKAQNDERIKKQKIKKRKLDPKYPKQLAAYSEKKYQEFVETKEKWGKVADKKKRGVPIEFAIYSIEQFEKYLEHYQELIQLPKSKLKQELQNNAYSMTGNKIELAVKIADGRVLGQIGNCPYCKGGQPKFNQSTGQYLCPGYRNLVYFVPCNKLIEFPELKRIDWKK